MAIAETVRRFDCRVTIIKHHERVAGTDVLQILSMATYCGEQLQLEAVGPEAEQALAALEELFAHGLKEHRIVNNLRRVHLQFPRERFRQLR